ncbi:MAG: hypothetical protein AAGC74_13195 [Verrucomicrobiota bacterium]
MPPKSLNPSEQVERIREILVGRQMGKVEKRLAELESRTGLHPAHSSSLSSSSVTHSPSPEPDALELRLQQESALRQKQVSHLARQLAQVTSQNRAAASAPPEVDTTLIEKRLSDRLETVAAEMTARVDARTREILHHLQNEILQWKNQTDRDLQSIREVSVDRKELKLRFARLASAAMEDKPESEPEDGYLL